MVLLTDQGDLSPNPLNPSGYDCLWPTECRGSGDVLALSLFGLEAFAFPHACSVEQAWAAQLETSDEGNRVGSHHRPGGGRPRLPNTERHTHLWLSRSPESLPAERAPPAPLIHRVLSCGKRVSCERTGCRCRRPGGTGS